MEGDDAAEGQNARSDGGLVWHSQRLSMEMKEGLLAICVLLAVHTYLRPGQLLTLVGDNFTPPTAGSLTQWAVLVYRTGTPTMSKTGDKDLSIRLDGPFFLFMTQV
jgi:hypothetical protein